MYNCNTEGCFRAVTEDDIEHGAVEVLTAFGVHKYWICSECASNATPWDDEYSLIFSGNGFRMDKEKIDELRKRGTKDDGDSKADGFVDARDDIQSETL